MQGQVEVWHPPTVQPVPWICGIHIPLLVGSGFLFQWSTFKAKTEGEFTFECHSLFWWIQHCNQKEWKWDWTFCQSLETNNRGEMHYGSHSPGQSEVRVLLRRRRTSLMFSLGFTLLLSAFFAPHPSAILPLTFSDTADPFWFFFSISSPLLSKRKLLECFVCVLEHSWKFLHTKNCVRTIKAFF